jgi:hypothetical protein
MAACGIPQVQVAEAIGISQPTLLRHFRQELDVGLTKVKVHVSNFIVNSIVGKDGGLKDERARVTLAIFFAKTRMGWVETFRHRHEGAEDGPAIKVLNVRERITRKLDRILTERKCLPSRLP